MIQQNAHKQYLNIFSKGQLKSLRDKN